MASGVVVLAHAAQHELASGGDHCATCRVARSALAALPPQPDLAPRWLACAAPADAPDEPRRAACAVLRARSPP